MTVTAGSYEAVPVEAALAESSQKGTPYIDILFRVVDGDQAGLCVRGAFFFGDRVDRGGKSLSDRTCEVMQLCGLSTESFDATSGSYRLGEDPRSVAIVVQDDDQGHPRVRFVNPIGAPIGGQRMTGAKALSFLRDLGPIGGSAAADPPRAAAPPRPAPSAPTSAAPRSWGMR
jgi:hypothetical protein